MGSGVILLCQLLQLVLGFEKPGQQVGQGFRHILVADGGVFQGELVLEVVQGVFEGFLLGHQLEYLRTFPRFDGWHHKGILFCFDLLELSGEHRILRLDIVRLRFERRIKNDQMLDILNNLLLIELLPHHLHNLRNFTPIVHIIVLLFHVGELRGDQLRAELQQFVQILRLVLLPFDL